MINGNFSYSNFPVFNDYNEISTISELDSEEDSLIFEKDELLPRDYNQKNNHLYKIPPIRIKRIIFDKVMKEMHPEKYQELGTMISREPKEIQEGCAFPSKTANFRKIEQFAKSILIDKKYLDVDWVDDFFSGNREGKCSWLNHPTFENKTVQSEPKEEEQSNLGQFVIESLNLKYVTLEERLPGTDERCSFIMLGRGIQGFVPVEEPGGRVILVITEDQREEVLSYVRPCCDLLVIEGSGLITSRRLKTLEFAHHCQLNYLLMADDNLQSFYVSESLGIQNWGEMYQMMEQAMVENGCSFVAMNSYNPRVQNEFPSGDDIHLEKDVLRAKLYMINVKNCENIVGERFDHLFPPKMEAWGEDLFFQLCLYANGHECGTIANDNAFLKRGKNKPNNCLESLNRDEKIGNKKAYFWKDAIAEEDAPEFHHEVYETLKQMVSHSVKQWNEKLDKFTLSDLGKKKKSDLTPFELEETDYSFDEIEQKSKNRRNSKNRLEQFSLPPTLYPSDSSKWINNFLSLDITKSSIKNESDQKYLNFGDKNLRACQVTALKNFQNLLIEEDSPFSGYFDMATGAGKTFIFNVFSACAHKLFSSNTKINVLIIEPKVGLLDQMVKDFQNFQKSHEHLTKLKTLVISSNHTKGKTASVNKKVEEGGYVLFCCQNSLENHLSILKNAPFVIYDEFHLVHERLLKLSPQIIKNGGIVIGFSATPNEKKKYFDKKIFEYSRLQAQKDGWVAPWVVERLPTTLDSEEMNKFLQGLPNFLKNTSLPSGKSLSETRGIIYLNPAGSTTDEEEVTSLKTADWLSKHLNKSEGLKNRVVSWHSNQSKEESNKAINLFLSCERDILINITKFVEGYNTDVEWAIVLQKNTRWDQILGRLIRLPSSRVNKIGLSTIEKIACIFVPKNEPLPDNFEHPNQEQLKISQQLRASDLEQNKISSNIKYLSKKPLKNIINFKNFESLDHNQNQLNKKSTLDLNHNKPIFTQISNNHSKKKLIQVPITTFFKSSKIDFNQNENSLGNENSRKRPLSPRTSKKTHSKKVQKNSIHM